MDDSRGDEAAVTAGAQLGDGSFLYADALEHVFSYLSARDRIAAGSVCRFWRGVACDQRSWRRMCLKEWRVKEPPLRPDPSTDFGWTRLYWFKNAIAQSIGVMELLGLGASTTDYPTQSIENTLPTFNAEFREPFWSSRGSEDENSNEWLLYGIPTVTLIRQIGLRAYQADWQFGCVPVFPSLFQTHTHVCSYLYTRAHARVACAQQALDTRACVH
eukprot:Opistho-1_new@49296